MCMCLCVLLFAFAFAFVIACVCFLVYVYRTVFAVLYCIKCKYVVSPITVCKNTSYIVFCHITSNNVVTYWIKSYNEKFALYQIMLYNFVVH